MLNLTDSFELLKKVKVAKYLVVKSEKDLAKLDFPYYIKADISAHKTEEKAVFKCKNIGDAKKNYNSLKKRFDKIVIQEQAKGVEMIVGIKSDAVFGKLLMVGFGGINAEILKDVTFRVLPVKRDEIEKMVKELKLYPTLVTREKYAVDKFIKTAEEISKLNIKEADFNPVILSKKDAVVVDARIEV